MSSYKEIDKAVEIFRENKCEFELMHCVSAYPFESKHASLNLINEMKKRYKCKVGYSGHEKSGVAISFAAVSLGATSLERHITLDRTMYGSDQAASLSTEGFRSLVNGVRDIEKAVNGEQEKKILDIEIEVAKKLRSHIRL
jgi:N-acetylneuraminate synthase